jgi:transcriptional regulator with XRE-family HTH domain
LAVINPEFRQELKRRIKFAGITQSDLARQIGLTPAVLSSKMNDYSYYQLTVPEIKQIIRVLAEKYGINRREEVNQLLQLAGIRQDVFQAAEWEQYPLNQLE